MWPDRRLHVGDFGERRREIMRRAAAMAGRTTGWVRWFRAVLGRGGLLQQMLTAEELADYRKLADYRELQELLADLRSRDTGKQSRDDPERMVTVRMPQSLHDVLADEASETNLSINKLAITKLLQPVDDCFVPLHYGRRRGRRVNYNRGGGDELAVSNAGAVVDTGLREAGGPGIEARTDAGDER